MEFHIDEQADADTLPGEVRKGIRESDPHDVGHRDWKPIHFALRSEEGSVVGGIYGATMWTWLMIDGLWISPSLRGKGLGRKLLIAAETEAISRGCIGSWLGTFDFQARDFYEHLGYKVFSELPGFPPGHIHFHLHKNLEASESSHANQPSRFGKLDSLPTPMATPNPSELIRVLCGQQVFERDIDSKILQAANGMSARLMFELFTRCDTNREDWASEFADGLMEIGTGDPSVLVGFDDGRSQGLESTGEEVPDDNTTVCEFYLRLEFTNDDASYYQFHLFPSLDELFIKGASRKREGPFQHLSLTLANPDDLQVFIQHLRTNPHLKAVHDSNEATFNAAPSHSI